MDGEKQVVIRLLECLCYCVEFSFVGAGIVGLRLAGHTADKITMHPHSKAYHVDSLLTAQQGEARPSQCRFLWP